MCGIGTQQQQHQQLSDWLNVICESVLECIVIEVYWTLRYSTTTLLSNLVSPAVSQALEERLKQEQREEVHALKEAHRRTLDILRQQSDQELQTLRFELEDEGKAKLGKRQYTYNVIFTNSAKYAAVF